MPQNYGKIPTCDAFIHDELSFFMPEIKCFHSMKRMLQGMKQKYPNTGKKNVQGVRKYFYV